MRGERDVSISEEKESWKVLSFLGRLPLVKMCPCVEFGRLGCTSFIFIKEDPMLSWHFGSSVTWPKSGICFSHLSHPGYRASGGVPWYSIWVAPSVLGFALSLLVWLGDSTQGDWVSDVWVTESGDGCQCDWWIRVTDPYRIQLWSWKHKFHREPSSRWAGDMGSTWNYPKH